MPWQVFAKSFGIVAIGCRHRGIGKWKDRSEAVRPKRASEKQLKDIKDRLMRCNLSQIRIPRRNREIGERWFWKAKWPRNSRRKDDMAPQI